MDSGQNMQYLQLDSSRSQKHTTPNSSSQQARIAVTEIWIKNRVNMDASGDRFWSSKPNLFWVGLAVLLLATHVVLKREFPIFTPPASPDKSAWLRIALFAEMFVHIAFLGAVIVGITNRIPSLKNPSYSLDGTLSIGESQPSTRAGTRWGQIGGILGEFVVYLGLWACVYGIVSF